MSNRELVSHWLQVLSPQGSQFRLDELGVCVLAAADGGVVRIEVPDQTDRVYLISYLGRASTNWHPALLGDLLAANFLNRDTNGATLAVDQQADQYSLCYSEVVGTLDPGKFASVVEGFMGTATRWREHVAHAGRTAQTAPAPIAADDDLSASDLMFRA